MLEYQTLDGQLRRMKRELEKNEYRTQGKKFTALRQETEEAIVRLDARAAELASVLASVKNNFEKISSALDEYAKEIGDIEDEDELKYIKKKLASQTELLQSAERECKSVLREGEEIDKKYDELRAKMPKILAGYNKCNEEFNKIIAAAQPEINSIKKKQAELEKMLDAQEMEVYKKIRQQNIYPVYVPLMDGNRCGGCRMDMPGASVAKIDEKGYIRCEHCGRIIFKQ